MRASTPSLLSADEQQQSRREALSPIHRSRGLTASTAVQQPALITPTAHTNRRQSSTTAFARCTRSFGSIFSTTWTFTTASRPRWEIPAHGTQPPPQLDSVFLPLCTVACTFYCCGRHRVERGGVRCIRVSGLTVVRAAFAFGMACVCSCVSCSLCQAEGFAKATKQANQQRCVVATR